MHNTREELVRFLLGKVAEAHKDLKSVSRALGKNDTYLQQFKSKGSPRVLPEDVRQGLADILGGEESHYRVKPKDRAVLSAKFVNEKSGIVRQDALAKSGPHSERVDMANIRYELILAITMLPDEALLGVRSMLELIAGKTKGVNPESPQSGSGAS